jgi:hypothetical protein
MQGTRQHVIPRFLLKGFRSKSDGKNIRCWVYPKKTKPYETNINNIAVVKEFYTQDNDIIVDKCITKAEQEFSNIVQHLRKEKATTIIKDIRIPKLLAHFEIRTHHLRRLMINFSNITIEKFNDYLDLYWSDERILKYFAEDNNFIRNLARKEIARRGLSKKLEMKLVSIIKSSFYIYKPSLENKIRHLREKFRIEIPLIIPEIVKNGHIQALKTSINPKNRIKAYSQLKYSLIIFGNDDLIIGDNILFACDFDQNYKTFLSKGDDIFHAFIPISSDRILIGSKHNKIPTINIKRIKEAIAGCSLDYFVSSKKTEHNEQFQKCISKNIDFFIHNEFENIMNRWIKNEIKKEELQF